MRWHCTARQACADLPVVVPDGNPAPDADAPLDRPSDLAPGIDPSWDAIFECCYTRVERRYRSAVPFGDAVSQAEQTSDMLTFEVAPDTKCALGAVLDYWDGKTHNDLVRALNAQLLPPEALAAYDVTASCVNQVMTNFGRTTSGDGHVVASYARVARPASRGRARRAPGCETGRRKRSARAAARRIFPVRRRIPPAGTGTARCARCRRAGASRRPRALRA